MSHLFRFGASVVALGLLLQGCAGVAAFAVASAATTTSTSGASRGDPSSDAVEVSRYQFIPDTEAMAELCAVALEAKIGKFARQDMKISFSRNPFLGTTTCRASL